VDGPQAPARQEPDPQPECASTCSGFNDSDEIATLKAALSGSEDVASKLRQELADREEELAIAHEKLQEASKMAPPLNSSLTLRTIGKLVLVSARQTEAALLDAQEIVGHMQQLMRAGTRVSEDSPFSKIVDRLSGMLNVARTSAAETVSGVSDILREEEPSIEPESVPCGDAAAGKTLEGDEMHLLMSVAFARGVIDDKGCDVTGVNDDPVVQKAAERLLAAMGHADAIVGRLGGLHQRCNGEGMAAAMAVRAAERVGSVLRATRSTLMEVGARAWARSLPADDPSLDPDDDPQSAAPPSLSSLASFGVGSNWKNMETSLAGADNAREANFDPGLCKSTFAASLMPGRAPRFGRDAYEEDQLDACVPPPAPRASLKSAVLPLRQQQYLSSPQRRLGGNAAQAGRMTKMLSSQS